MRHEWQHGWARGGGLARPLPYAYALAHARASYIRSRTSAALPHTRVDGLSRTSHTQLWLRLHVSRLDVQVPCAWSEHASGLSGLPPTMRSK